MQPVSRALGPMAIYIQYLAEGKLAYQFSRAANKPFFYPRVVCPYTGSEDYEWRESAGQGTIYAATYFYPREEPSYAVVLVDLDEGFRMMSRVMDVAAEQVRIGARVRLSVRPGENDQNWPFFVLHEQGASK